MKPTVFANSLDYWSASQWALDAGVNETRTLHGLTIIIENPQYSMREGWGWMSAAPADYGYIAGTVGADGDEVDCYVGPNPRSQNVFIVDQNRRGGAEFDEHKVMLNYDSAADAKRDYLDGHTEGADIFRSLTPVSLRMLKLWLRRGDMTKPYSEA
jgi:hypothetical protein